MPMSSTWAPDFFDSATIFVRLSRGERHAQAAQPVIGAQLHDDDRGLVQFECARQSLQPSAGCFAAHAGVHNAVSVPLVAQSLLQQGDPALSGLEAIAGTQAVAKHEDGTVRRARRVGQQLDDEPAAHSERPGAAKS